jgi:chromosome segregation ATPase
MNQPLEQRITKIEQRLDNLEKQNRENNFTISDIAHKTTIALGMLTAQEDEIREIKATLNEHTKHFDRIEQTQAEQGKRMDAIDSKLDLILKLLQPRFE